MRDEDRAAFANEQSFDQVGDFVIIIDNQDEGLRVLTPQPSAVDMPLTRAGNVDEFGQ